MANRRIIQSSTSLTEAIAAGEISGTTTWTAAAVIAAASAATATASAITADSVIGTVAAGGTGATEGAYDTAAHRDAALAALTDAIVVIAELIVDVGAIRTTLLALIADNLDIRTKFNSTLVNLKSGGLMASS